MNQDQQETTVHRKPSRAERCLELEQLAATPEGIEMLGHLYRYHFPGRNERLPPSRTMMDSILAKEYPEG